MRINEKHWSTSATTPMATHDKNSNSIIKLARRVTIRCTRTLPPNLVSLLHPRTDLKLLNIHIYGEPPTPSNPDFTTEPLKTFRHLRCKKFELRLVKLGETFFEEIFYEEYRAFDHPVSAVFIENLKDVVEGRVPRHDAAGVCKDEVDRQRDGDGDEKKNTEDCCMELRRKVEVRELE